MTETKKIINNRYDFVYLFDVKDGNPNGDPDAGNQPRIDPETGHGIVTDVCLKRKIRNFVTLAKRTADGDSAEPRYDIYVKERGILANEQRHAYKELKDRGVKAGDQPNEEARMWMCKQFYDVRTFGAVMSTGKIEGEDKEKYKELIDAKAKKPQWNCGQVRGPVQITFGRSVDPILLLEHSITRVALTNVSDTRKEAVQTDEGEKAGSGQFGQKNTIPYGLYRAHGFVSPQLAAQTGFTENDLDLLWISLTQMFEHDRSAARGLMSAQKLIAFKHDSALGNAPAHKLFELVKVKRSADETKPARAFSDYVVEIERGAVPAGITVEEKI
ncbi:MAG: type I-C CRISPR-associated protein Cas7/Csd2 [Thermodesulfobacteriota bacterium]|nr:type I-C CRISPR-associated protein Cas7/Csd2 [Thermodesulfobacteriota bacterium]